MADEPQRSSWKQLELQDVFWGMGRLLMGASKRQLWFVSATPHSSLFTEFVIFRGHEMDLLRITMAQLKH